jgi:hypothetical protein
MTVAPRFFRIANPKALAKMTVPRPLLRSPAAIDGDRRARDLVCRRRTQESNGAAKLCWGDEIQGRLLLGQKLLDCFLLTYASLRSDQPCRSA